MVRLYHFPLSPFCRKVRLVLAEKRIETDLVEERYWERSREFLLRNPAGQVPILDIDGRLMAESQAIAEYLEETRPDPRLMPEEPTERAEVRRLCGWFDDKFHREVSGPLLRERVMRKLTRDGYPDSRAVKAALRAIRFHLDYMDWLLDRRRWLAGDGPSLADFTAAAHLSCLDYLSDVDWDHSRNVHEWYAKVKSRPAFRGLLADVVPGFPPAGHYPDLDF